MQHRQIPVACIQTRAHDRENFEANWPRITRLVDDAGRRGAALIVLPEGTVPGYVLGASPVPPEQLARASRELAALARSYGATVVYGAAKIVAGQTFNAAVAIGPDGRELGHASKQFLWHFDRRWYRAGDTLEPIETPLGRLGLLVCADGRIPTIAATLCDRGAELLVMPTAWVTSGRDPRALENIQADLMANVRARENGVPFVVANKAGFELESVAYCGKSAIIDADGVSVARGSETGEEIVFGKVDIGDRPQPERRSANVLPQLPPAGPARDRARIAFTLAHAANDIDRFRARAADADVDVLLACGAAQRAPRADAPVVFHSQANDALHDVAGLRIATVTSPTFRSPRGVVAMRLAGVDMFLWHADGDAAWHVPFARTRAAELRTYVVVFDAEHDRAFAVDPDGIVVAGTFDGLLLAAFAYDRARAAATTVAPTTDVFEGLRRAEAIRASALNEATRA